MFLLRLFNIAYKYLTMLQSLPGTGKHELKKKRRAHRQPVRHEKIAQEEKAFLKTGRETTKTELVKRKMCSHRPAGNK
jgi:hypothetical protein